MKSKFWMSLAILAGLAIAGTARSQNQQHGFWSPENPDHSVERAVGTAAPYAAAPEGYHLTVQLLSNEALKVSAKLCQTGNYAEAEHLLQRVLQINPHDQRIKQALAKIWAAHTPTYAGQTPRNISHCLQQLEHMAQQSPKSVCETQTNCSSQGGRCVGVFGASAPSCASKCQTGKACSKACAPCCPQTVSTEATRADKCKCKENCDCGNKCKCAPADAQVQEEVTYQIISIPDEIAQHCPVLSGRVKFVTRISQPGVWVYRPEVPVRVHYIAVPVYDVPQPSRPVPPPARIISQEVVEIREVPAMPPMPRPVVEVRDAPVYPQPLPRPVVVHHVPVYPQPPQVVEDRLQRVVAVAPRHVEPTPVPRRMVIIREVAEDEEGRTVVTERVVPVDGALWQILSRAASEAPVHVVPPFPAADVTTQPIPHYLEVLR